MQNLVEREPRPRSEPGVREETVLISYDDWRNAMTVVLAVWVQASEEDRLPDLADRLWAAHLVKEAEWS